MTSALLSILVFGGVFGVGLLAMRLRLALPEHHLSADTKDTVKLAMGLVATMTALVLAGEALRKFGGDSLAEFVRNHDAYVATL